MSLLLPLANSLRLSRTLKCHPRREQALAPCSKLRARVKHDDEKHCPLPSCNLRAPEGIISVLRAAAAGLQGKSIMGRYRYRYIVDEGACSRRHGGLLCPSMAPFFSWLVIWLLVLPLTSYPQQNWQGASQHRPPYSG